MKSLTIIFSLLFLNVCNGQSITWQKIYNNNNTFDNDGYDICKANPGFYFLVGVSRGLPEVKKISEFGDTIWTKIFFGYSVQLPCMCIIRKWGMRYCRYRYCKIKNRRKWKCFMV